LVKVQKVNTFQFQPNRLRDVWNIIFTPDPTNPPKDLALNVTFSYNLTYWDVNVSYFKMLLNIKSHEKNSKDYTIKLKS